MSTRWTGARARACTRTRGFPAFTLPELLIVLAVISTLIALLVPSLGKARISAKSLACLSSLRSIGQAVVMYCDANKERFPISSHTGKAITRDDVWLQALQPYGVTPEFRRCPLDPFRLSRPTSYATNEHFEPLTPGVDYNPATKAPLPGGRVKAFTQIGQVPRPSLTIYVYEPEGDGVIDHLNTHAFATAGDVRRSVSFGRHLDSAHFLYADGHAKPWAWNSFAASFSPSTSPFDPLTAR